MTSFRSAILSALLGALLLAVVEPLLIKANPSPFSSKADRGGLTVIAKSEAAP